MYRRSLRHMSESTLREVLSAELKELNETGSHSSNPAARAAVHKAREQLQNIKQERTDNPPGLATSPYAAGKNTANKHTVNKSTANDSTASSSTVTDGNLASAIAQAIAESMTLTRVPTANPFVFYDDPLQYLDWEINFAAAFDKKGVSDTEKMSHLHKYVGGKAKQAILRFFRQSSSNALKDARELLKKRFGNDLAISDAYRKELENWPRISSKDTEALTDFSDFLQQCKSAMTDISDLCSLNDGSEIKKMTDKLPDWLANCWKRKVTSYKNKNNTYPRLSEFASFVMEEAEIAPEEVTTERSKKPAPKQEASHRMASKRMTTFKTETAEKTQALQPLKGSKYCHQC